MKKDDQDDITLDTETGIDDSVLTDEHQGDTIKKLKEKLKDAETKAKENMDGWQRAQADFINLRKRDDEAKADFLKFANSQLILEILPVLDAMNIALSSPQPLSEGKGNKKDLLPLGEGAGGGEHIEPIHKLLLKTLKNYGLEEINPVGEKFDPNFHEAIGMIKTEKKDEDHKVLEVLQKGYIIDGKSLRPAKVRVGEFTN